MKKLLMLGIFTVFLTGAVIFMMPNSGDCEDCNKGKSCSTSYDCGEIGVCYCQYSYETYEDTGGGIPESGTCYFE
jgi:hypothetical protein